MSFPRGLTRYWIEFAWPKREGVVVGMHEPFGFGVTAVDLDDALNLLRTLFFERSGKSMPPVARVVCDVDVASLREMVHTGMHPTVWRGVWFPMLDPMH